MPLWEGLSIAEHSPSCSRVVLSGSHYHRSLAVPQLLALPTSPDFWREPPAAGFILSFDCSLCNLNYGTWSSTQNFQHKCTTKSRVLGRLSNSQGNNYYYRIKNKRGSKIRIYTTWLFTVTFWWTSPTLVVCRLAKRGLEGENCKDYKKEYYCRVSLHVAGGSFKSKLRRIFLRLTYVVSAIRKRHVHIVIWESGLRWVP